MNQVRRLPFSARDLAGLKRQLKDGGRLILPIGDYVQELMIVTRRGSRFEGRNVLGVRFVPMTGEIRKG